MMQEDKVILPCNQTMKVVQQCRTS